MEVEFSSVKQAEWSEVYQYIVIQLYWSSLPPTTLTLLPAQIVADIYKLTDVGNHIQGTAL